MKIASYCLVLLLGCAFSAGCFHIFLRRVFKKIPFSLALKVGKFIYATPSFPKEDVPENCSLLESDHCLLVQENSKNPETTQLSDLKKKVLFLEELFNHVPVALWFRSTRGKITYCNKNYASIFSTSPQKVTQESLEICPSLVQHALKTRQSQVARRHIVFSGERHYVEIGEVHVNQGLVGYAIDITEMDMKINDYAKQIYSYEDLLNHLSSPIAIFDTNTRLILYNEAYLKQFNFQDSFLRNSPTLSEVLDFLRQERKLPEFEDFLAHKQSRLALFKDVFQPIYELSHQPDGKTLRLVITPYPLGGIVYIFEDVTEKLALEHDYKTLVAVQKTTLDHLHEGIIVFGSDYRVRLCNLAFEKMQNLSSIQGKHLNELQMEAFPLLELMSKRSYETSCQQIDDYYISYAYTPLPDGSHFFSFLDVSTQFQIEKIEKEKNKFSKHFLQLSEDFVTQISTEVKTPLDEMLKGSNQSHIKPFADKLSNIVNLVLDTVKLNNKSLEIHYQKHEIHSFFQNTINKILPYYDEKKIKISLDSQTRHCYFDVDEKIIENAFLYLLYRISVCHQEEGKFLLTIRDIMSDRIEIVVKNTAFSDNYDTSSTKKRNAHFPFLKEIIHLHGDEIDITHCSPQMLYIRCIMYVNKKEENLLPSSCAS